MTPRKMYNTMLRIHKNTEAKIRGNQYDFLHPEFRIFSIEKPKITNVLFYKYKK